MDRKISDLEKEFSERRYRAMQALHALNGGSVPTAVDERKEQASVPSGFQDRTETELEAAPPSTLKEGVATEQVATPISKLR